MHLVSAGISSSQPLEMMNAPTRDVAPPPDDDDDDDDDDVKLPLLSPLFAFVENSTTLFIAD